MNTPPTDARLLPMSEETRAHAIRQRRLRLGIKSQSDAAELSKKKGMYVSRDAIMAAENPEGSASDATYQRLEAFYDAVDEETGHDEPDVGENQNLVTFDISGNFGVEVTVKGPVADLDALEKSVARLIREMRSTDQSPQEPA